MAGTAHMVRQKADPNGLGSAWVSQRKQSKRLQIFPESLQPSLWKDNTACFLSLVLNYRLAFLKVGKKRGSQ